MLHLKYPFSLIHEKHTFNTYISVKMTAYLNKRLYILIIIVGTCMPLSAQTTSVLGKIFDSESGIVLPFASISFAGTSIGTMSDGEGAYKLSTDRKVSRIAISTIGYQTQYIPIQKGVPQEINVALNPKLISIGVAEVTVDKHYKNPSIRIMKRVVDQKSNNNPALVDSLSFDFYERLELDFNDLSDKLIGRKIWGNYDFIWDYLDSSEARISLPLFFSESLGDVKIQQSPEKKEKHVKHTRSTWLVDEQNTSSLISEYVDVNLYENNLLIINKSFVSPLHDRGGLHYRYYILDTLMHSGRDVFHLAFVPRRRGELTFEGELWIDTLTYGLSKVSAKISEGANLNFIRKMSWVQDYVFMNSKWLLEKQVTMIDLNLTGRNVGKYAKVNSRFYNFDFSRSFKSDDWASSRDLSFDESEEQVSDEYWDMIRPDSLLPRELEVIEMVDSIQSSTNYKIINGIVLGLTTGYVPLPPLEVGQVFNLYSYNAVEGHRFSLGVSTSRKLSRNFRPIIYAAYGTLDNRWKYGVEALWIQKRQPRLEWFVKHSRDIDQLGMLSYFDQGNLLNSLLSFTTESTQLALITQSEASVSADFGSGFISFFGLRHIEIVPQGTFLPLFPTHPSFETTFKLMYQKDLKFIGGAYKRAGLGNRSPRYTFMVTKAWPDVFQSQYNYCRYTLDVNWISRHGPLGRIEWNIDGGTYSGVAPYTLLELQPANQTFMSVSNGFNLIHYMEFVSDSWAKAVVEWHGEGIFFNRIPLLQRLSLREVASVKAVKSWWDPRHETVLPLPENTTGLNGCYVELVLGVENILTFISVNCHFKVYDPSGNYDNPIGVKLGLAIEI